MPQVIMPKMGDAMEEGTLLSWKKQDGESVSVGDVLAEIETDKSNVEVEAEDSGVLHVQAKEGEVVPVGGIIATIGDDIPAATSSKTDSAKPASLPVSSSPASKAEQTPPVASGPTFTDHGRERLKASPLARRVAHEQGIDIARITGTGPYRRIVEADVLAFAKSLGSAQPELPIAQPTAETPQARSVEAPAPPTGPTELSPMRKVIARRMTESKTTIPHFYLSSEIDMNEALELREKLNGYDDSLSKITLNDMIVKATAKALAKYPAVNAAFRDDKVYPGVGVHVGIAVALDEGLIVPVVRDADRLALRQVSQESKRLIQRARDKKLLPQEYSGGTFTVSNLGGFDVENFLAIIDPSQGAILAVASIVKKPVVGNDDSIVVRSRMNVTLSGDHRVMDGATGAKFLQELKRLLQSPLSLLE